MLTLALVLGIAASAAGDNLLGNPGFEQVEGGVPAGWKLFVQPQEGAFGRVDGRAHTGAGAVMLHTPLPYLKDPANNWSQTLAGKCAGKTVQVSGHIRTENATEAAIWIQSWRKAPWGVIQAFTSSTASPVYGTMDWQPVVFTADIPAGADFVMVRCVMKGTGTAWFDDLAVVEMAGASHTPGAGAAVSRPVSSGAAAPSSSAPAPPASGAGPLDAMEREVARLQEANRALASAMEAMQTTNDRLLEELLVLRESLAQIQAEVRASAVDRAEDPHPGEPAPPLVPHGEPWRPTP